MIWQKCEITINNENFIATEPLIISASRATDIPAFYSDWLIDRFEQGYCTKINPFNRKTELISLKNVRFIVFWTKNPENIIEKLSFFDNKHIKYYFQFTLNDYDNEKYEQNLVALSERIKIFKALSEKIGKEKVIWRFDPLILSDEINIVTLIQKIITLGNEINHYTNKLVFSFVDLKYKKVLNNLFRNNLNFRSFTTEEKFEFAKKISEHNLKNWGLNISTCAEEIDFNKFSINKNKCIDYELILKLAGDDEILFKFLQKLINKNLKDIGQRKLCNCIFSKDLGSYNTCRHFCVYCYANTSKEIVLKKIFKFNKNNTSIIG
jgi:DNA repair photolyase